MVFLNQEKAQLWMVEQRQSLALLHRLCDLFAVRLFNLMRRLDVSKQFAPNRAGTPLQQEPTHVPHVPHA